MEVFQAGRVHRVCQQIEDVCVYVGYKIIPQGKMGELYADLSDLISRWDTEQASR